ncbi:MAG: hypothetical protein ABI867_30015 [Kofleriaceae bacterium]
MNNLKALIATLVIGSSSAAMAKPVLTVSGSASISIGSSSSVVVRDHRAPVPAPIDPCATPAPAPIYTQPVAYQPVITQPTWQGVFWNPTNTRITASSSTYLGTFGMAPVYIRAHDPVWFNLTAATRIDSGRELFNVKGNSGTFTKLQLKGLGGQTQVTHVALEFVINGRRVKQNVRLSTSLTRSNPSLTFNLAHNSRQLDRVIVYGASGRGSAYQILAM